MKKILLGTSALAMTGAFAGQANAATWDLDWGGYYEAGIAFASSDYGSGYGDVDYDGVDVVTDSEIIFTPSITLDNGLTFGVDIQLEGTSGDTGDRIDESFAFVSGSFGQVLIGSENSAGYKMMYGAPDVTWIGVNSASTSAFIPGILTNDVFRGTGGSSFIEVGRNNDAERITYFTPRFSGFQLGVSYARDALEAGGARADTNANGTLHDIFDIGANYVNSFGAFDVAVAGRYGTGSRENGDSPSVYAFGLNLGYAGFKIGGSYAKSDDDGGNDGDFFDLGVSYSTGPWGMSFTYAHGENDASDVGAWGNPAGDSDLDNYLAGVTYKLGPGVKAGAWAGYADLDVPGTDAFDIDGFYVGTGFKLNF